MPSHHFMSYSPADAQEFALKLADALTAGPPAFSVWLDKWQLQPGEEWDEQIADAIRACDGLLFVMTLDSVEDRSVCKQEWTRALKYKKPVIPILLDPDAEMPFRLGSRQWIDFSGSFEQGLARLRQRLQQLASPQGELRALKDRLADAERDLRRADETRRARIQDEIAQLEQEIERQQRVAADPERVAKRVNHEIERGIERERVPSKPVIRETRGRIVNLPPGIAPSYFQGRHDETRQIGTYLQNQAIRLITVTGRGGIGKTTLVCRLLQALESGELPDDGGPLAVDGIVYLSANGSRQVNTPNLYADLSKLLPDEDAARLEAFYKNPRISTQVKMAELLLHFAAGRTVLLLDNFEDLVDPDSQKILDAELDEALHALLTLPTHSVKTIITSRLLPRELVLVEPGRQARLDLDEGLRSPYAENLLREKDADGKVGLRHAPEALLGEARERTRGYPRALEALFAVLAADRDTSLQELLDDTARVLPDNVIEALVGEAFSRLDQAAQRVIQALAVYNRPVPPVAVDYLLQPSMPSVQSAQVLRRLVTMQFARREGDRYYLHPVDREYAYNSVPQGQPPDRGTKGLPPFTQFALLHRGAEYFKQARVLPKLIKQLDDVAPQLAEYELRYAGQDYDTAADVLMSIDGPYLDKWGLYHLLAELHERLQGKVDDPHRRIDSLRNLGVAYSYLGYYDQATMCHEQALDMARKQKDRGLEQSALTGLGHCYAQMGQTIRAMNYYQQALSIARAIKDSASEGILLGDLAQCYLDLGRTADAIEANEQALSIARKFRDQRLPHSELNSLGLCYANQGQIMRATDLFEQALAIARDIGDRHIEGAILVSQAKVLIDQDRFDEAVQRALESAKIAQDISTPRLGSYSNYVLALARLYTGDLAGARAAAETALLHNAPEHNHNAMVLLGIVTLRHADRPAAIEAFKGAIAGTDALLEYTPEHYQALDAKALALCGMALCEGARHVPAAIAAYRAARAVNSEIGIVGRALRLLDALAVADETGMLAEVRAAAGGEKDGNS